VFKITVLVFFFSLAAQAEVDLECYFKGNCSGSRRSSSNNPSTGSQVRINPSTVPTDEGFGLEGLFYKSEVDVSLVRGMGRIGAAISPSNSEETFFGPPGFELDLEYLNRKQEARKLPNQKFNLSTAISLINKQGEGLDRYSLNFGVMAKYNKLTKSLNPGVGLSAVWGPLSVGGSFYNDETQIEPSAFYPLYVDTIKLKYKVQTYNVGLFLSSLILDYSHLTLTSDDLQNPYEVSLISASLLVKKFILSVALRTEDSDRLAYNFDTKILETKQIKNDYFGGVQYRINNNIMVGVFYNYYLLHEGSFSSTLFF
jgi:hypothetical protein